MNPASHPSRPARGSRRRGVRFTRVDEIDLADLRRWLAKSIEIQWDYRNLVKRKGRLERLR